MQIVVLICDDAALVEGVSMQLAQKYGARGFHVDMLGLINEFAAALLGLAPRYLDVERRLDTADLGTLFVPKDGPGEIERIRLTPRWFRRAVANAGRRVFGPEFWLARAVVSARRAAVDFCLITGVEQMAELEAAAALRLRIVRVTSPRWDSRHDFVPNPRGGIAMPTGDEPCHHHYGVVRDLEGNPRLLDVACGLPQKMHPTHALFEGALRPLPDASPLYTHVIDSDDPAAVSMALMDAGVVTH